ncbi:hypothetical protein BFS06_11725 [Clostridium perfringens]|uniref:hypothetical protein n=1 Tax=Clostridium perfringens TaxID=1502 RepID=UPI00103C26B4|nr:hypothetical protein [Clostridium perfringens]TBX14882.1 hypothetical protein BFS06_11725 [Clostridium perfringens]
MNSDLTINITNFESYFDDFIDKYNLNLITDEEKISHLYIKNISNIIELKNDLIEIFLDIVLNEILSKRIKVEKIYEELKSELKLHIQSISLYNSVILKANLTTYLLNNNYINIQSYLFFNIPESVIKDYIDIANFIQASIFLKTLEIDKNKLILKRKLEVREKEEEIIDEKINKYLSINGVDIKNFQIIEIVFNDNEIFYKGINNVLFNLNDCKKDIGYSLDTSKFNISSIEEEVLAYKIIELIILLKCKKIFIKNSSIKKFILKEFGKYVEVD